MAAVRNHRLSRRLRLSRDRAPHAWATACAVVERVTGVAPAGKAASGRAAQGQAYARQLAFYVAVIGFDVVRAHIGQVAGFHKSYVEEALPKLEAARDADPLLEDLLDNLVALAQAEEGRAAA